ncbi:MAG: hypothetical protein IKN66_09180, partial [Ruminococcus sp.]|nr:hypothetical protein [Ruminococcus sp.]
MIKARFLAVISSFLMLTGCGSYSESTPAVTVQSENPSVMMQSDSSVSSVASDKQEVTTAEQHEEKEANGMQIAVGDKQFPVN